MLYEYNFQIQTNLSFYIFSSLASHQDGGGRGRLHKKAFVDGGPQTDPGQISGWRTNPEGN